MQFILQFYADFLFLKIHRCFSNVLKICILFGYNPQIIYVTFLSK